MSSAPLTPRTPSTLPPVGRATGNGITSSGSWIQVAYQRSYLYVDGRLVATTALATNLGVQKPGTPLTIGARCFDQHDK